jgi:hypothetical protein
MLPQAKLNNPIFSYRIMIEEVKIKKLSSADFHHFIELLQVFETVFEMEKLTLPDNTYLQQLASRPDFFIFTALLDNKGDSRPYCLYITRLLYQIVAGLYLRPGS